MSELSTRISLAFRKNPLRFVVDMLFIVILLVNFFCFITLRIGWILFLVILLISFIYAKVVRTIIGWQ